MGMIVLFVNELLKFSIITSVRFFRVSNTFSLITVTTVECNVDNVLPEIVIFCL